MKQRLSLNDFGCLLLVLGASAFIPLAIIGRHLLQLATANTATNVTIGWLLLSIYASCAILNFYLSFVRPWIHAMRGDGDYKFVSGIPVVHALFLILAVFALPPSVWAGAIMLALLAMDTGATHWVALAFAQEYLPQNRG